MKISTRGEYGLRAMLVLARNYKSGSMPLREIAEIEDISEQYLEQLFRELRKNQLVVSQRGAKGGYILAKAPEQISIGAILTVLEGPIGPMQCVTEPNIEACQHTDACATRIVWEKLKTAIDNVLEGTTLADLLKEHQEHR